MSAVADRVTPAPRIPQSRWKDVAFENLTRFFALFVFSILLAASW